ncbi:unnamed protein product [Chrysoparadoxa australica]
MHLYDGLVVRSGVQVDQDIINAGKNLRIVGRAGTGVDNIDIPAATAKGVLVMNTPGGNTVSTAELAMSHILALARNIPEAVASMKEGRWDRKKFMGAEVKGKTVGIVGLGRIGREVAKWCKNFDMHVIGYDPILTDSAARAAGIEPTSLEGVMSNSDFITLHTPLTPDTKGLIGKANLAKCKKGVRIVNCARGGLVVPDDLVEALNSGQVITLFISQQYCSLLLFLKVAGASLDVFTQEPPPPELDALVQHPHVICTPHLGASTTDAQVPPHIPYTLAPSLMLCLTGARSSRHCSPDVSGARWGRVCWGAECSKHGFCHQGKCHCYQELPTSKTLQLTKLRFTGKIGALKITLHGKDLSVPEMAGPMQAAVLKGALGHLLDQEVNYVNAVSLAKQLGLDVEVAFAQEAVPSGYVNAVTVDFEIEGVLNGKRTVTGTVMADKPRVVNIDGLGIDFHPRGKLLFFNNRDTPGVLGEVSTILATHGVNIANFALGRKREGGTAMSCITVDGDITSSVSKEILQLSEVNNVVAVDLPWEEDAALTTSTKAGVVYQTPMPAEKPVNPEFSSGPCKKRPGYSLRLLQTSCLGRSHRSKLGKARLKFAIEESKRILGIPDDYLLGIVPASDTGAFEMAMWSLLGPRNIDACYWESFGKGWYGDAVSHLGLADQTTEHTADYGKLPDLGKTNPDNDILFTYNGTTSGVCVPNLDWISDDRTGLTFNDCTSAAFAMDIDWSKADVSTYSWQKAMGGEGAHGVLILSPRAVESRLENHPIEGRPLPKIFRMVKKGKVDKALFEGSTINTPSMLCVEDYIDALAWADSIGGLPALMKRSQANLKVIEKFVEANPWIEFLAEDASTRSSTSVCLCVDLTKDQVVKKMAALLETEHVAYDIGSYRDAPPGLRIWCGATVDVEDVEALMPWLEWAYKEAKLS